MPTNLFMARKVSWLWIIAPLVLLQSCTQKAASYPGVVVVDGNSQASGTIGDRTWVADMEGFLPKGFLVTNLAVSGQTTRQMNEDAGQQVDQWATVESPVKVVIVHEVMNDLYFGATAKEALAELEKYCTARRAAGFKVLAVCPQPQRGDFPGGSKLPGATPAEQEAEYSRRVVQFMEEFRVRAPGFTDGYFDPATDLMLSNRSSIAYNQADKVHWSSRGQEIAARYIASLTLGLLPATNRPSLH